DIDSAPCASTDPPLPRTDTLSLHDALPISPTIAGIPPARVTITGREAAMPSMAARPRASSDSAGTTTTEAAARMSSTSLRRPRRSEEHTSELQSPYDLVCRLLLEKKKTPRSLSHRPSVPTGTSSSALAGLDSARC